MAKTNLKKSYWQCNHGCPVSNVPCKHLERKMDNPDKGRLSRRFMEENIEAVQAVLQTESADEAGLRVSLETYGLQEYEIELIMDRYVSNLSLAEIAEKQDYVVNKQKIWRLLQDTTDKLKKSPEFKEWLINLVRKRSDS